MCLVRKRTKKQRKTAALGGCDPRKKTSALVGGDPQRGSPAFWQRDYWDRFIRDERHFDATKMYIESNPVAAGLVNNPVDWPWSSAGKEDFTQ